MNEKEYRQQAKRMPWFSEQLNLYPPRKVTLEEATELLYVWDHFWFTMLERTARRHYAEERECAEEYIDLGGEG